MARRCWAESLGDCKGGISGEHLISKCVLPETTTVTGLFADEPVTLNRRSLTSNILCKHHNESSSPLDSEAGRTIATLEDLDRLRNVRSRIADGERRSAFRKGRRKRRWNVRREKIGRANFERWLAKTSINLCVAKKQTIWPGQDSVPQDLAAYIFGAPPPSRFGVGMIAAIGDEVAIDRTYSFTTFSEQPTGFVVGSLISFASIMFLLQLGDQLPPLEMIQESAGSEISLLPLAGFKFHVARRLSHEIDFHPPVEIPVRFERNG